MSILPTQNSLKFDEQFTKKLSNVWEFVPFGPFWLSLSTKNVKDMTTGCSQYNYYKDYNHIKIEWKIAIL